MRGVAILLPCNFSAYAALNNIWTRHIVRLRKDFSRKVVIIFELESQREAEVIFVQFQSDVLKIAKNWPVLFGDLPRGRFVGAQDANPEVRDALRRVLDLLDVAGLALQ